MASGVKSHDRDRKIAAQFRLAAIDAHRRTGRKLPIENFLFDLGLARSEVAVRKTSLVEFNQNISAVAVKLRNEKIVGRANFKFVGGLCCLL